MRQVMQQLREQFGSRAVTGVSPLLLANCVQLGDLDTPALLELSKVAECRLVYGGERIFRQDDRADSVYLLLDGTIRLQRADDTGYGNSYDVLAPYATFGDLGVLGEEHRRYTAVAAGDSMIVEIPLRPVVKMLNSNPAQAIAWRGAVLARLHRKEPGQVQNFGWRILGRLSELFDAA